MRIPPGLPPWMWPFGFNPFEGQQQTQQPPDIVVPVRVRIAMEFIAMMHQKEMKRGAIGEGVGAVLEIDGMPPSGEEAASRDAACQLLSRYFDGKLTPDAWEALRYEALKRKVQQHGLVGQIVVCPNCPEPGLTCKLCRGSGRVLVTPMMASQIHKADKPAGNMPSAEEMQHLAEAIASGQVTIVPVDPNMRPKRPKHPEVDDTDPDEQSGSEE